jgi:hypothetical protein
MERMKKAGTGKKEQVWSGVVHLGEGRKWGGGETDKKGRKGSVQWGGGLLSE